MKFRINDELWTWHFAKPEKIGRHPIVSRARRTVLVPFDYPPQQALVDAAILIVAPERSKVTVVPATAKRRTATAAH